jgi:hypothetical protein
MKISRGSFVAYKWLQSVNINDISAAASVWRLAKMFGGWLAEEMPAGYDCNLLFTLRG